MMNKRKREDIPDKPAREYPRWFTEEYEGAADDMAEDLFAVIYWRMRDEAQKKAEKAGKKFEPNEDLAHQSRLYVDAVLEATQRAETNAEAFSRAFAILAYKVKSENLFMMTPGEYATFEEWLLDKIPAIEKGSTEYYNIMYMVNTLLPTLERIGGDWDPSILLQFRSHWSKAKACVPALSSKTNSIETVERSYDTELQKADEEIVRTEQQITVAVEPREKKRLSDMHELLTKSRERLVEEKNTVLNEAITDFSNTFHLALELISDVKVPVNGVNGVGARLAKGSKEPDIFEGEKCLTKKSVVYMIELPTAYERAYESLLRNLCKFHVTDPSVVQRLFAQMTLAGNTPKKVENKKGGIRK